MWYTHSIQNMGLLDHPLAGMREFYSDDSFIRTHLYPVDISGFKQVFRITESPSSLDVEIGSHTFCPD